MPSVADSIGPFLGPEAVDVPAMNDVPWWFFDGFPEDGPDIALPALDPESALAGARLPPTG